MDDLEFDFDSMTNDELAELADDDLLMVRMSDEQMQTYIFTMMSRLRD